MFTIIKGAKKFEIPNNEVSSLQATSDGILIMCLDKTEIRYYFNLTPALRAIIGVADNNLGKDLTIDLNAAMTNQTSKILTMGNKFEGEKQGILREPPAVTPAQVLANK